MSRVATLLVKGGFVLSRSIYFNYSGTFEELSDEFRARLYSGDRDVQIQDDGGIFDIYTLLEDDEVSDRVRDLAMSDLTEQATRQGVPDIGELFVRVEEIVSWLSDGSYRYVFDRYGSWLVTDVAEFYHDFDENDESVIEYHVEKMYDVLLSIDGVEIVKG